MKSVPLALLALGAFACSGQIDRPQTGGDTPGGTSGPGGTTTAPPGGGSNAACNAPSLPGTRLWRLTHSQFATTLADQFGYVPPSVATFPADARLEGFANAADQLGVPSLLAEYYARAADELATEVLRRGPEFFACPLAGLGGDCLATFARTFATKAWRRPATAADVAKLTAVFASGLQVDADTGVRVLVQAVLLSPHFLFRTELGSGRAATVTLDDYEIASALSYTLWDAPPDAALMALAAAGKLHDPATLAAEARRLLASPRKAPAALDAFVQQWLKIDTLAGADKDQTLFPSFNAQVAQDLLDENRTLVNSVVFDAGGDRSLRTLLTAPVGYLNSRTAGIYGAKSTAAQLTRADLDGSQRRGLLTSGAFLAAHADGDSTRLVDRGRFLREEVLCLDVPAPPKEFKFDDPLITEDMTQREKLTVHAKNPACASCHALFDGVGFALENYDPIGQWRTTEKGKPIDPTGSLPLPGRQPIQFGNFVQLVDQIAQLPDPYDCFAGQYLQFATGRSAAAVNQCEREPLARVFSKSGYQVDSLVMAVVGSPSFITRRNGP